MAWEIRVSAARDFHLTIFVQFQTSHMSAYGINDMATLAPKKNPHKTKNLLYLNGYNRRKVFERGFGGNFFQKVSPNVSPKEKIYSSSTLTGLPVAMDSLHAMVKETDLKASA